MVPELVRLWVAGWAVSRGTPRPVEQPWGFCVEVDAPGHVARRVLPHAHEAAVRQAAASVTTPHTWLKVPEEPSAGCTASTYSRDGVLHVRAYDAAGERAATGQLTLVEDAGLGVPGVTDEGRALYETLGRQWHAPLAACAYLPREVPAL